MNEIGLICRQIKDIINQADSVMHSRNYQTDLYAFLKYSDELKTFILNRCEMKSLEVIQTINNIPVINIKAEKRKYWYQYLIFPWYLVMIYNEALLRDDTIHEVILIKHQYEKLFELLCTEK